MVLEIGRTLAIERTWNFEMGAVKCAYLEVFDWKPEEVRPLRHYFYIPRPRSHINLYIEYDFNYMKGAQRRTDVVPPLTGSHDAQHHVVCGRSI